MDLSYNIGNIFPVPIHVFDIKDFKLYQKDLIDYAYTLKSKGVGDVDTPNRSNLGGWQSRDFHLNNESDKLHSVLMECITLLPLLKKDININVKAWVNINSPGSLNVQHSHPGCDLSGVLWVKCPDKSGNIFFHSPSCFETFQEIESYTEDFKNNNNYYHAYWFPPIEGRMLIFPSHLQHEVKKNLSNEDRISASFNIKLENN
mgnify:FL=1